MPLASHVTTLSYLLARRWVHALGRDSGLCIVLHRIARRYDSVRKIQRTHLQIAIRSIAESIQTTSRVPNQDIVTLAFLSTRSVRRISPAFIHFPAERTTSRPHLEQSFHNERPAHALDGLVLMIVDETSDTYIRSLRCGAIYTLFHGIGGRS